MYEPRCTKSEPCAPKVSQPALPFITGPGSPLRQESFSSCPHPPDESLRRTVAEPSEYINAKVSPQHSSIVTQLLQWSHVNDLLFDNELVPTSTVTTDVGPLLPPPLLSCWPVHTPMRCINSKGGTVQLISWWFDEIKLHGSPPTVTRTSDNSGENPHPEIRSGPPRCVMDDRGVLSCIWESHVMAIDASTNAAPILPGSPPLLLLLVGSFIVPLKICPTGCEPPAHVSIVH